MRLQYCSLIFAVLLIGSGCHHLNVLHDTAPSDPSTAKDQDDKAPEPKDLTASQSADVCMATAKELEGKGFHREAIAVYERALTFEPNRKGIMHRLARLHARTGDATVARELFETAAAEAPQDVNVLNDFGYFLFEQEDLESAEAKLRHALDLAPDDQRCRANLALTLAAAERFQESLALFEQVVGPAAARSNLAVLLAQAGRLEESRSMLAEVQQMDPANRQADAVQDWMDRPAVDSTTEQADQLEAVVKLQ